MHLDVIHEDVCEPIAVSSKQQYSSACITLRTVAQGVQGAQTVASFVQGSFSSWLWSKQGLIGTTFNKEQLKTLLTQEKK